MSVFYISESSLNEYLLLEHGGAHRRYLKILADKDKKLEEKENRLANMDRQSDRIRDMKDKIHKERLKIGKEAQKYNFGDKGRFYSRPSRIDNFGDDISGVVSAQDTERISRGGEKRNNDNRYHYAKGKHLFQQDFGGSNNSTKSYINNKSGHNVIKSKDNRDVHVIPNITQVNANKSIIKDNLINKKFK